MEVQSMITQPTEAELALTAQENLFALFRAMATVLSGGEIEERPGLSRHHTFPTNPMYKGVWATHLAAQETDAAIDETIAWFTPPSSSGGRGRARRRTIWASVCTPKG